MKKIQLTRPFPSYTYHFAGRWTTKEDAREEARKMVDSDTFKHAYYIRIQSKLGPYWDVRAAN